MENIALALMAVCGLTYLFTYIVRYFTLDKICQYPNGIEVDVANKQELMDRIRKVQCPVIKQLYFNEAGDIVIKGKAGKHTLGLEYNRIRFLGMTGFYLKRARMLNEENLILDYLVKEQNPSEPIDPQKRFNKNRIFPDIYLGSLIGFVIGFILFAVNMLFLSFDEKQYINTTKAQTFTNYPDVTVGEAFDNFFTDPEWSAFKADNGQIVVEFTGKCYYNSEEVETCLQFVEDDNGIFQDNYLSFDDISQDKLTEKALLNSVFETYYQDNNSISDESTNEDLLNENAGIEEETNDTDEETYYESDYVDMDNLNYAELYEDILLDTAANSEQCRYGLYDMNSDGRKEILIFNGTCEADMLVTVYSIDDNGGVYSAGDFYCAGVLYGAEDGNGIYAADGKQGVEQVRRITLVNETIQEEELWTKELAEDENYYSNDYEIEMADGSDLSLLENN